MFQIIFSKDLFDMLVPFVDLKQRYIDEKNELNKIFKYTISSGNLIGSDSVNIFEKNVSSYLGKKYCVSLNSGTDALMMAMYALGIGKGDEVITTPISFIATLGAIVHLGAKPVLVDVDNDLNINPNLIEGKITKKTKAIIPVHWTGRMCKMDIIRSIAKKYNLKVIEDAAQAIGSTYKGTKPGHYSDIATFSAHPLKVLNALGDAGYLVSNKKKIYNFLQKYKNHGLIGRDNSEIFGINSRLDSLNAAVLSFRLKKLNQVINKRARNIEIYMDNIKTDSFKFILDDKNSINSNTMLISLAEKRDKLNDYLRSKGIESLVYYGKALHQQKAFIDRYGKKTYKNSEKLVKQVISLPFHQYLDKKKILHVCDHVNKFYNG